MSILEKIVAHKQDEIPALDARALRRAADQSPEPRDFLTALKRRRIESNPSLIAELKRASPSKGILAPHLDLLQVADIYTQNGAAAISVLTDEKFFMGKLETLRELRDTQNIGLPLLRKDFIIQETQLYQTRAYGADAVLLIAAALPDDARFADLHTLALELGLTPLVEVHNEAETERALKLKDVRLIGINNRNLATFEVSLETSERLRPMIPAGIPVVAESGIFTAADVDRLARANVDAILVGEALVTADDIGAKVRELSGARAPLPSGEGPGEGESVTKIKICGIKTLSDALAAIEAGADYLGFNFYSKSARFIDLLECAKITAVLKAEYPHIKLVGVFVNAPLADIQANLQSCSLDLAQLHGDESPETLAQLAPHAFKAFRGVPANMDVYSRVEAPACLIDASVKGAYGGTGITADWPAAAELAKGYPLLLAGGLTPDNVAAAVRQVRPWGVDVASGVEVPPQLGGEIAPGSKDLGRMKAFVQAVRSVTESGLGRERDPIQMEK